MWRKLAKDLLQYYKRKWYICLSVAMIVSGGMIFYHETYYAFDSMVSFKHIVIDISCGVLTALFVTLFLFVWIDSARGSEE